MRSTVTAANKKNTPKMILDLSIIFGVLPLQQIPLIIAMPMFLTSRASKIPSRKKCFIVVIVSYQEWFQPSLAY